MVWDDDCYYPGSAGHSLVADRSASALPTTTLTPSPAAVRRYGGKKKSACRFCYPQLALWVIDWCVALAG